MAKILVTGCRGTLGAPLVAELRRRGHDVWGCDLQHQADEQFIRADIQSYRQLEQMLDRVGDVDFVYHLAAEFGRINGEEYYETLWADERHRHPQHPRAPAPPRLQADLRELLGDLRRPPRRDPARGRPAAAVDHPAQRLRDDQVGQRGSDHELREALRARRSCACASSTPTGRASTTTSTAAWSACSVPRAARPALHRLPRTTSACSCTSTTSSRRSPNVCENFKPGEVYNIGGTEFVSVEEMSNLAARLPRQGRRAGDVPARGQAQHAEQAARHLEGGRATSATTRRSRSTRASPTRSSGCGPSTSSDRAGAS